MVYKLGARMRKASKYRPARSWIAVAIAVSAMFTTAVSAENWLTPQVNPWWPVAGVSVSGQQPVKADVPGHAVETYNMYWSVDGGQRNLMPTDYTHYPHKEASLNVSSWTWRGMGPYELTYLATDLSGKEIARNTVQIYVNHPAPVTTEPTPITTRVPATTAPTTRTTTEPVPATPTPVSAPAAPDTPVPISSQAFYVDPNNNALRQAAAWKTSRPADAATMERMGAHSQAKWFGDWNQQVERDVRTYAAAAQQQNAVPVLVAYNIPQRDCGSYSAGGSATAQGYRSWIQSFANGIGSSPALVILEPDALAGMDCLSKRDQGTRLQLLAEAVATLEKQPATSVYIDAGNPRWIGDTEMARRLTAANISQAEGFSLNVSNFFGSQENLTFGEALSSKLSGKHFVVDTSRNGAGTTADQQWCNPSGRALGTSPTMTTNHPQADAFLWIKAPGESDGTCNGGPSAGTWWPEYALGLAQRAGL